MPDRGKVGAIDHVCKRTSKCSVQSSWHSVKQVHCVGDIVHRINAREVAADVTLSFQNKAKLSWHTDVRAPSQHFSPSLNISYHDLFPSDTYWTRRCGRNESELCLAGQRSLRLGVVCEEIRDSSRLGPPVICTGWRTGSFLWD